MVSQNIVCVKEYKMRYTYYFSCFLFFSESAHYIVSLYSCTHQSSKDRFAHTQLEVDL